MRLTKVSSASLALLLNACAISPTPSTLLSSAPDAVYSSDKSAQEIVNCVVDQWENTRVLNGGVIANYRPTASGYRATLHMFDKLMYMAEIDGTKTGSKTKVYVNPSMISLGKNPTVGQAANCQ